MIQITEDRLEAMEKVITSARAWAARMDGRMAHFIAKLRRASVPIETIGAIKSAYLGAEIDSDLYDAVKALVATEGRGSDADFDEVVNAVLDAEKSR